MKTVNTLVATVVLGILFAVTALADCQEPIPGQIPTVPCTGAAQPTSYYSTTVGQTVIPPAASSVDVIYVAEAALHALLSF